MACQLYAANHDLDIIGRYKTHPGAAGARSLPHHALTAIEASDVEVVLTVGIDRDHDHDAGRELRAAIEELCSAGVEVVLVDAPDGRTSTAATH